MLNDVHQGDSKKLSTYGPSKLTCSSGFDSNWVILVEGRADVINLLKQDMTMHLQLKVQKLMNLSKNYVIQKILLLHS